MPIPLIAAAALANTVIQPTLSAITNAQNRKNALQDWNRQNAYNHPAQQMQRLKEAGLNPNLVYGGGATTTAQPVHSPQMQVPNVDLQKIPESLGAYQNLETNKLEQQKVQGALALQEAQKKNIDANTLATLTGIDKTKLDIESKGILNKFLPDYASERNRQMAVGTDIKISQNEMDKLMFPHKLDQVLSTVANIKARTDMIPTQKKSLLLNMANIRQKMHYYGLSQSQQLETGKILQESALIKNLIQGKQLKGQELQNDLLEIKKRFKDLGLSETVTSDMIKQTMSLFDFF